MSPFTAPFAGVPWAQGSSEPAPPAPPSSTLLDGLVAYWALDEASGTRVDKLGNNDLTAYNAPARVAGQVDYGAEFDYDLQTYLQREEAGDLPQGAEAWTIAIWWKPYNAYQVANEYAWIFNLVYGWWGGNLTGFRFQLKGDGVTSAFMFDGAGGAPIQSDPILHRDLDDGPLWNTWIFDWFTYDGTTFRAQRNRTGTIDEAVYRGMGTLAPRNVCIGGRGELYGGTLPAGTWLDGIVDEVGMWSRVLTSDELDELWNGGAGVVYPFS